MEWLAEQISGRTSPAVTAQLLQDIGISAAGLKSIEENEITGEMLVQFCEADIKDAFTVFKDRFLLRKLLRAACLRSNHGEPYPPVTTASNWGHSDVRNTQTDVDEYTESDDKPDSIHADVQTVRYFIPNTHSSYGSERVAESELTNSPHAENVLPVRIHTHYNEPQSTQFQPTPRSILKLQSRRNQDGSPLPKRIALASAGEETFVYSEMAYLRKSSCSPTSTLIRQHPTYSSAESSCVHYKTNSPSSSNCQSTIKRELVTPESDKIHNFPSSSKYHDVMSCTSRDNEETSTSIDSGTDSAIDTKDWYHDEPNDVIDLEIDEDEHATTNNNPKILTDAELLPMCYRSPARHYSAAELMSKKEVRTKANPAQRAGQMLIRNAAQAAGLWDSVPFLKDIAPQARHVFFNHVFAGAPHLAEHVELVWQKLKEALLNRRKYLLDKGLGKRLTKREKEITDAV